MEQFSQYLSSKESDLRKVYDPLSTICLSKAVKQLNMIKTVFETEGLLAMTDEFNQYCERTVDFVMAEKFYLFTCIHMLSITNPKTFYRERSFKTQLRLFHFLADLKQAIEEKRFGKDLNMDSIRELQQYMMGIFEILLCKLEPYEFICPQVL